MQETIGGNTMMSIKIPYDDLQILCKHISDELFAKQLYDYLKDKKDNYYFYGYEPLDVSYLEITIPQLEKILANISRVNKKHLTLYETINEIYQAGITTNQTSVFLYGRNRA